MRRIDARRPGNLSATVILRLKKTAPMGHAFSSDTGQGSCRATGVQQSAEKPGGQLPQFQRARVLTEGFGKELISEPNPCLELRLILLDLRTPTDAGFRNPSDVRHRQGCQLVDIRRTRLRAKHRSGSTLKLYRRLRCTSLAPLT